MVKFLPSMGTNKGNTAVSKPAGACSTSTASKKRNSFSIGARWSDFNYRVVSSEDKDDVLNKLGTCIAHGVQIRGGNNNDTDEILVAGANSVMRLLERGQAAVLVVCRDGVTTMSNPAVEAARVRHTAVVVLPSCSHQLAQTLGLKRVSCLALRKAISSDHQKSPASQGDQQSEKEELAMRREAAMDDLRDALLGLSRHHTSGYYGKTKSSKKNRRNSSS